jgi:hypothetical protein
MKALEHIRPGPAEIIEIDRHMGKPSQKPKPSSEPKRQPEPPAPSQANRWVPITAIVCSIASVLIALGTYFHTVHRDNTAIQSVNSDEHTKLLIHDQLAPLQNKVEEMDGKLSEALGELKRMNE